MPLEIGRLRRSKAWLIAKRRPEIGFYALNLWCASWHEFPAGSLEDDDDMLADAAICAPDRWPDVRDDVMRGWQKFNNGRLYHRVVAEKVADAGAEMARHAWRRECDRIRKENRRRKEEGKAELEQPPEPQPASVQWPTDSIGTSAAFQRTAHGIPAENALNGKERKGEGEERRREEIERKGISVPPACADGNTDEGKPVDSIAPKAKGRRNPETPLPDPWPLSDRLRELAAEKKWQINIDEQHDTFCDWTRDKGITSRDWHARERNWMRIAHAKATGAGNGAPANAGAARGQTSDGNRANSKYARSSDRALAALRNR